MRIESLENLTLTRYIKGMRDGRNHHLTYVTSLCICLLEQELGDIATDRKLRRAIIAHVLKGH